MLKIYTDGGSRGNPGPGGFGVVLMNDNKIIYKYGKSFDSDVTNNQMELCAILHALDEIISKNGEEEYIIYSDSAYCVNACNNWIWTWSKNNWINSKKETVKNTDLMKRLWKYISAPFPNFQILKCAGHSGIIGNELADALATSNEAKYEKILKENDIKDIEKENLLISF